MLNLGCGGMKQLKLIQKYLEFLGDQLVPELPEYLEVHESLPVQEGLESLTVCPELHQEQ